MPYYHGYDVTTKGLVYCFYAFTEGEAIETGRSYCTGTLAIFNEPEELIAIIDRLPYNQNTDCVRIEWMKTGLIETQIPCQDAARPGEWLTINPRDPVVFDSLWGQRYTPTELY